MNAKKINIPHVVEFNNKGIEEINIAIQEHGVKSRIESVNWMNEFSYKPFTNFYIARTDSTLYIKYTVTGNMLKAVYSNDLDPVYKDSCVEFFCKLPESDHYMNFEFNCIGTCLASTRKSRKEDVVFRSKEELEQIQRYTSLPRRAFCEMEGLFTWEITVGIPLSLLGISSNEIPEKILANFYKCADDTGSPHFVSWNPIGTEKPDFHCPQYFGELFF